MPRSTDPSGPPRLVCHAPTEGVYSAWPLPVIPERVWPEVWTYMVEIITEDMRRAEVDVSGLRWWVEP